MMKLKCWAESIRVGRTLGTIPPNCLVFYTRKQAQRNCSLPELSGLIGAQPGESRSPYGEVGLLAQAPHSHRTLPAQLPLHAELPFSPAGKPQYFLNNARSVQQQKCLKQQLWALKLGLCSSKVGGLQPQKKQLFRTEEFHLINIEGIQEIENYHQNVK